MDYRLPAGADNESAESPDETDPYAGITGFIYQDGKVLHLRRGELLLPTQTNRRQVVANALARLRRGAKSGEIPGESTQVAAGPNFIVDHGVVYRAGGPEDGGHSYDLITILADELPGRTEDEDGVVGEAAVSFVWQDTGQELEIASAPPGMDRSEVVERLTALLVPYQQG